PPAACSRRPCPPRRPRRGCRRSARCRSRRRPPRRRAPDGRRGRRQSVAVELYVSLHVAPVNRFRATHVKEWSDLPLERTGMFQRTISSLIFAAATFGATAAFAQTAPDVMIKE